MAKGDPKGGRPFSLLPDEQTLKIVKGLGNIQATTKECAAVLGVTERTFITFKQKNSAAAEAYEHGEGEGRASLRRRQFKMSETNATMAIWLGKQYLGQTDKVVNEHSGPGGGAIKIEDSRKQVEAEVDALLDSGKPET